MNKYFKLADSNIDYSEHESTDEILNLTDEDSIKHYDNADSDSSMQYDSESECCLENDPLYTGSDIKLNEFALSFIILCKRININMKAKNILLQFIESILPLSNKVPSSYNKLIKQLTLNSFKKTNLCNYCFEESCSCPIGTSHEKKISVCEFDVAAQITSIVKKNFNTMCAYKGFTKIL